MTKKTIGIVAAITAFIIVGFVIWGLKQPQKAGAPSASNSGDSTSDVIFYYGQECPHCQNVEKFIADNKIDEKVMFAKKEVWHNTANNAELEEKAKECALEPNAIGVPFLWARGKCYVGEVEVENFFKKEAGIQ